MWGRRRGRLDEEYEYDYSSGEDEEDPRRSHQRNQGVFSAFYRGASTNPPMKSKTPSRANAQSRKQSAGVVASMTGGIFGAASKEKVSPQKTRPGGQNGKAGRLKRKRAQIAARRRRLVIGGCASLFALFLFLRPTWKETDAESVPVPPLNISVENPEPNYLPHHDNQRAVSFQSMFRNNSGSTSGEDDPDIIKQELTSRRDRRRAPEDVPISEPKIADDMGGDHKLNAISHARLSHHFRQESAAGILEAIHLEFWTGIASPTVTVDGGSPKEETVRACRIPRACRLENGTFLLPAFFKPQQDRLASCGLYDPLFVLPRDDQLPERHAGFHLDTSSYRLDLVDVPPIQGSYSPLLLIDLIPAFFSLSAVTEPIKTKTVCTCYSGLRKCGSSCLPAILHPATLLSEGLWEKLETGRKVQSWESQIFEEMQQSPMDMNFLHESKLYPSYLNGLGAVCFNSLITAPVPYTDVLPAALDTDFLFFADNGTVSRKLTRATPVPKPNICHVDLTISQRYGEREMKGIFSLKDKLLARFKQQGDRKRSIVLSVHIAHFENMTYTEQVKSVVNSNILVAPHADSVMNAIFLKKGSYLVEVFPFSYHPTIFNWYAALRGVEYAGYMAEPDEGTFRKCVEESYPDESKAKTQLYEMWGEAASKYKQGNQLPSLRLEYQKTTPLKLAGACSKKQVLRFDPERVADIVEKAATLICTPKD